MQNGPCGFSLYPVCTGRLVPSHDFSYLIASTHINNQLWLNSTTEPPLPNNEHTPRPKMKWLHLPTLTYHPCPNTAKQKPPNGGLNISTDPGALMFPSIFSPASVVL